MSNIVVSNGDLCVGLDSAGQVKEVYYPNNGSGNHVGGANMRHKIGVYVDGAVHWIDDGAWRVSERYYPGSLVGQTVADNQWLGIRLEIQDFVDSELNVLARSFNVVNLSNRAKTIKLYLHQAFLVNGNSKLTMAARLVPAGAQDKKLSAIVHYGGGVAFGATLLGGDDKCFDDYSIGKFGDYNGVDYAGVWCDAADGALAKNRVDCGGVDSIFSVTLSLKAHDSSKATYLLSASTSPVKAVKELDRFAREGVSTRLNKTTDHYKNWLEESFARIRENADKDYRLSVVDALTTLRSGANNNGAIITGISIDGITPVVQPARAAMIADVFSDAALEADAVRVYRFLQGCLDSDLFEPAYLASGALAPNDYGYASFNSKLIAPVSITDTAVTLWCLGRSVLRGVQSRNMAQEWKQLWLKFGVRMADSLTDAIDMTSKLPLPSWHAGDSKALTTTVDVAATYGALSVASRACDRLKELDGVIKYSAVADDIAESSTVLWNEERSYYYHGVLIGGEQREYDSRIDTYAELACRAFGLMSEHYDEAEATLLAEHIDNNGTYMRGEADTAEDDLALADIMALSLLMCQYTGADRSGLMKACQKMLTEAAAPAGLPDAVTSLPLLRAVFIKASLGTN